MTMPSKIILSTLAVILFAGCTGFQKQPPVKQYFDLTVNLQTSPENRQNPAARRCQGESLLVKELFIAPAFDSHAFVYKVSANRFQTDFYNEFITYPARLITEQLSENLCRSPYFSSSGTQTRRSIRYRLSGKITQLYGDLESPDKPRAIIEIRLLLEKRKEGEFSPFLTKTYRLESPIPSGRPEQLAQGWKKGLEQIIRDFLTDYQALVK